MLGFQRLYRGEVTERLMVLVSKTSVRLYRTGGSNPPLSGDGSVG